MMPMARRTPVKMSAVMPGKITLKTISLRVADRLRASSSQFGSSRATPAAVLSRIGQTAANASRKYTGASPTPSTITAIGIHDSGEIMRSSWNSGMAAPEKLFDMATSTPSGTPMTMASPRPTATRCRLKTTCSQISEPPSISLNASAVGKGAKALAIGVDASSAVTPTDHNSKAQASPTRGRPNFVNNLLVIVRPPRFRCAAGWPASRRRPGHPRP